MEESGTIGETTTTLGSASSEATDTSTSGDGSTTGTGRETETGTTESPDGSTTATGEGSTGGTVLPFDCNDPDLPVTIEGAGSYSTISDAVFAAGPGATVQICPGTYEERFVVIRELELAGAGMDLVEIVGDVNTTVAVSGVYFHGHDFTIRGGDTGLSSGNFAGTRDGDALLLQRVAIEDAREFGVHASDLSGGTHPIRLEDCRITGVDASGQGAGIYMRRTEGVVLDTELALNSAEAGGGILLASSTLQFEGGHVHQNDAAQGGGALLLTDFGTAYSQLSIVDSNWASGVDEDNVEADVRCVLNSSIGSDVAGFLGDSSNAICDGDPSGSAPACCLAR